jgi:phosphoheptose isomerase
MMFEEHIQAVKDTVVSQGEVIDIFIKQVVATLEKGNKLIIFGNGGSASVSSHLLAS